MNNAIQSKLIARIVIAFALAVMAVSVHGAVVNVKVSPSPYNPVKHAQGMKIEGLTAGAAIKIYTVAGVLIRELKETGGIGSVIWNGRNEGGRLVASGVYIAHIKGAAGVKKIKLAVEK